MVAPTGIGIGSWWGARRPLLLLLAARRVFVVGNVHGGGEHGELALHQPYSAVHPLDDVAQLVELVPEPPVSINWFV